MFVYFGSDLDLCHDYIYQLSCLFDLLLASPFFPPKHKNHGARDMSRVVMRELIKVVDHSVSIAPLHVCLFS